MRKILAVIIALAAAGCGGVRPPETPAPVIRGAPIIPATWTLRSQPVTAPHAAVAVAFALEVVYPVAGNVGGGGFIVYRTAAGEVAALDYREAAPSGASRDMYVDSAGNVTDKSRIGHLAAGVPGSVAGL